MTTKIIPITEENLDLVSFAGAKFGMPRSEVSLKAMRVRPQDRGPNKQ